MEYLIFDNDGGEPKVTGIRNGSSQSWFDDDFWANNQHIRQFMWPEKSDLRFISGVRPDFSLELLGLPMESTAKHTDLIYHGILMNGHIVSSKLRSLLEKFTLPEHHYYSVTFHKPDRKTGEIKEVKDYWYLYWKKETGENTVDFAASSFDTSFHVKYLNLKDDDLKVSSFEDYMRIFFESGTALRAISLVFNKNFNKDLDFWECRFLSVKRYVSSRLLTEMQLSGITNIRCITLERARQIAKLTRTPSCDLIFSD